MSYIGLDIGTTGAKALLVDEDGTVLQKGYAGYGLISDGSCIEQRTGDWIECGAKAILQATALQDITKIEAISLSTQGASTVAVDAQGQPIGNALTWMDTRATKEAEELSSLLGHEWIYRRTGWRINPALDAAKIMYMKRQALYSGAAHFYSTLEYMNLFLTGNAVCDPSNASIRQIYDVQKRDYDDDILKAAGIRRAELPPILPTGALVGKLSASAAAATGLPAGIPVYNGAHDQYCASIGVGAVQKGDMLLSAGTTWVVMGIGDQPMFSESYIASGVHPVPGLYGALASLVGSGASMQWFKNTFLTEDFDEINRYAQARAQKVHSLFFFPYLSGANYPIWNLNARGAFIGIGLEHDRFDFARAIMEGVAFGVRQTLDDFKKNGTHIHNLKMMGGAAKSALWTSIVSAAANVQVEISQENEACALGAAMIAAAGSKRCSSLLEAARTMSGKTKRITPEPALTAMLSEKYDRYQSIRENMLGYYS